MPSTPPTPGPLRPADVVNEEIRALFPHRDARLTDEQRETYRRLLAELREIQRGDVTTAA